MYQPDETIRLEVRLEDDTVWLNRLQMAELFGRDVKTIGKHVNNALREELKDLSVIAKFATTASDGKTYQDLRGGNSILSSRHLRSLLLLFLMMTVGVMGVWGQDDEKPADLKVGGCSETWLRVIETEALPSITGAKVDILFETAK